MGRSTCLLPLPSSQRSPDRKKNFLISIFSWRSQNRRDGKQGRSQLWGDWDLCLGNLWPKYCLRKSNHYMVLVDASILLSLAKVSSGLRQMKGSHLGHTFFFLWLTDFFWGAKAMSDKIEIKIKLIISMTSVK